MEIDFSALASRVAAFSDVLGCIILSNDGLVLGAFPPGDGDGDGIRPAWLRFAALGEPERAFVKIDDEVWAYVRAGTYAAFAVATGGTRPGILLDHLEQALLVAGESRDRLQMARAPGRVELVAGAKPRVLAPEPAVPEAAERPAETQPATESSSADTPQPHDEPEQGPEAEHGTDPSSETETPDEDGAAGPLIPDDAEIDPVALAREFAGLLQEDRRSDENS